MGPWSKSVAPLGQPEEGQPERSDVEDNRRLVGIDLGIVSQHTVRVLGADGSEVCRRRCQPTVASLHPWGKVWGNTPCL